MCYFFTTNNTTGTEQEKKQTFNISIYHTMLYGHIFNNNTTTNGHNNINK